MSFKNLSLTKKLIGAFACVLLITAALGCFAINRLRAVNKETTEITTNWMPAIRTLGVLRTHLSDLRIGILQHMLTPEKTQVAKWEDVIKTSKEALDKDFKEYETLISSDEERKLFTEFRANFDKYYKLSEVSVGFSRENKMTEALANSRGAAAEAFVLAGQNLSGLVEFNSIGGIKAGDVAEQTYKSTSLMMLLALGGTLVGGFTVAVLTARSVNGPVSDVSRSLASAGNEIGSASQELTASSQGLANSAARSASSLEETAASLREIEKATNENVGRSENVTKLTEGMRDAATTGNASMQKLVAAMTDILRANEKIQELVKIIEEIGEKTEVIDEIVFQTKLLSFNASVEAERAGEHGRGFAVVAQEVGNLAAMSGKAALEIAAIVKTSVKSAESVATENRQKVEQGDGLVKETAAMLQRINAGVVEVLSSAREILDSSRSQSGAIGQINVAVQQLDRDTQSMSATAEESAAAAAELDAQAGSLNGIVQVLGELVTGRKDGDVAHLPAQTYARPIANNVTQFRKPTPKARAQMPRSTVGSREGAPLAKAAGAELESWEEI